MASSGKQLPDFKARVKQRLDAEPALRAKYFNRKTPEGLKRSNSFCQLSDGTIYLKEEKGFLGQGKFGSVYKFNLAPECQSTRAVIAVKQEDNLPETEEDQADIADNPPAYEILNNAVVNHDLYGFGAFAGDLNDSTQPHYALMLLHTGVRLTQLEFNGYKNLLNLLNSIANSLLRLHLLGYAHGDLNNKENILSSHTFAVSLIDFDFTRRVGEATYDEQCNNWAPEKRNGMTEVQLSQDIYELGTLFNGLFNDFILDEMNNVKPKPKSFKALIKQMRNQNPAERPSIVAVCGKLNRMITKKASDNKHRAAAAAVDAKDAESGLHKRKHEATSQPSVVGKFKSGDNKQGDNPPAATAAVAAAVVSDEPKKKKLKI